MGEWSKNILSFPKNVKRNVFVLTVLQGLLQLLYLLALSLDQGRHGATSIGVSSFFDISLSV